MSPQTADPVAVRACLERILAGTAFANARRDQQFLRFVCEETLAGHGGELKETVIATRVFGRRADYDPRIDSIVRVVGSHVRKRLGQHYQAEGAVDPIVISLPRGGYEPVFEAAPAGETARPTKPARRRRWLIPAVAAGVLAGLALGYLVSVTAQRPDRTAIVVIPFAALDGSPETAHMAEALSEDITTELARGVNLRVVARTTSLLFRNQGVDVRSIGARLGVGSLLEGSVRRSGDRVKVTAQLVELRGGYHLWSESFEGPAARLPEFQEGITRTVRRHLGDPTQTPKPAPPLRVEAQDNYFQARLLLRKGMDGRKAAVPLLERAVAIEPAYTVAWAALSTAYSTMAFHVEGAVEELVPKAKAAATRTLELDPDSAEACVALGGVAYARDRDWAAADLWFRRALAASPNYARARTGYGLFLMTRARTEEAVDHLRRAHQLDPLSSTAGNDLAVVLWCARRYRDAIDAAGRTLTVQADFPGARVVRGMCFIELREYARAATELDQALASVGRAAVILGAIGYGHARAGKRAEAEALLPEIERMGVHFHAAVIAAGLNDHGRALDRLDRALAAGETDVVFFPSHPAFAAMHGDAGFRALLARVGL